MSVIQHKSITSAAGQTSVSLAFDSPVTAGNRIIVGIRIGGNNSVTLTSDTQSNTYFLAQDFEGSSTSNFLQCYSAIAAGSGALTITQTASSPDQISIHILEVAGYSGAQDTNGVGGNFQNSNVTAATVSTQGAISTTDQFIFAMFADNFGSGVTWTAGSGFTAAETSTGAASVFSEYGQATSAAIQTATATANFGSPTTSIIVTFKASGGGGGVTVATTSLPNGSQAQRYSATLSATGGASPYSWAITSGNLPSGLSLDSASGTIAGQPTVGGLFKFTVKATDTNASSGTKNLSILIASMFGGGYDAGPTGRVVAARFPVYPQKPWYQPR